MKELLQNSTVRAVIIAAVGGALAAARVDYEAYQTWKTWHDAAVYDWRVASFRWFKGASAGVVTALAASGLGRLLA